MSPFDRTKYPHDWEEISLRIKERAAWRCECSGECGANHYGRCERHHGDNFYLNGAQRKRPVTLTTAHYPDSDPMNCSDDNLLALCERCHLKLDLDHHLKKASATRARKAGAGTMPLFELHA